MTKVLRISQSNNFGFAKLIVLVLFSQIAFSQSPYFHWARSFGSVPANDSPYNSMQDTSRNIINGGVFSGTIDLDPGPSTYDVASSGQGDAYIIKIDSVGNFLFGLTFGGALDDGLYRVYVDSSNNIYACGYFMGTVDFDPSATGVYNLSSQANTDGFVVKLSPTGSFIWAIRIGGSNIDHCRSICVDASNNVYVGGIFGNTVDFDPGPGTYTLSQPTGGGCGFIVKLNSNGNFVWAKTTGGISVLGILTDSNNNVFACGDVYLSGNFDSGFSNYMVTCVGMWDGYVLKLDPSGNFVWVKTFGSSGSESAQSIRMDGNSDLIIAGGYENGCDFDPGPGTYTVSANGGNGDVCILKLSNAGNFIWVKCFGGIGFDCAIDIDVDAQNNIYTTGYFEDSVNVDPSTNQYFISQSYADAFLTKYDQNGNYQWNYQFGGNSNQRGQGLDVQPNGNIIFTCRFMYVVDFDPTANTYTLNAGYCIDPAIVKLGVYPYIAPPPPPPPTSLKENDLGSFSIFPNPTSQNIIISSKTEIGNCKITLTNILGEVLLSKTNELRQQEIELPFPKGIYQLEIRSEGKIYRTRIIKE